MSFVNLVVLVGFYYVSLVFNMYVGVMDNHGKREEKGTQRVQYGRITSTGFSHVRCGKSDIFPTFYIQDLRPWCFSPRPYKFKDLKKIQIGVHMKKWQAKYESICEFSDNPYGQTRPYRGPVLASVGLVTSNGTTFVKV
jgi:hypothetical protein